MWSLRALVKATAFTTFAGIGGIVLIHEEIQSRIRSSTCYVEAFKYLYKNVGAVNYFGNPLKAGYSENFLETEDQSDSILWYKVPLRGPNGKGFLYYKAVKDDVWYLSRVEVELDKLPGKKYLIMDENLRREDVKTDDKVDEKDEETLNDNY